MDPNCPVNKGNCCSKLKQILEILPSVCRKKSVRIDSAFLLRMYTTAGLDTTSLLRLNADNLQTNCSRRLEPPSSETDKTGQVKLIANIDIY